MAVHNYLHLMMDCPRCGTRNTDVEVELKVGEVQLASYRIGDAVPGGGSGTTEGYAECGTCGKDFWVMIELDADRIVRAAYNPTRQPYIAGPRDTGARGNG
jgi:hypothetical protein